MFSILIITALLQLWLIFAGNCGFKEIRLSFIKAALVFFVLIFLNTEILSFFNAISSFAMISVWLAENACLLGFIFFQKRNGKIDWPQMKEVLSEKKEKLSPFKAYIIIIFALYLIIFLIALFSVPNTVDSLTYHMARVASWAQFGSVSFYPTSTLRQLYSNPLAEYGLLNIFLLTGGDRFVNLLQFGSLIGCGFLVSLIAREFNLDYSPQIFATFLTTTFPMAIMQATSTQNDLVVTFFTLSFFLLYLRLSQSEKKSVDQIIFCALALGLAFLTKGTAYIYCAVIGIGIFVSALSGRLPRQKKTQFLLQSVLIVFAAIAINTIQYARNYDLFGSPLATGDESYVNKNLTPSLASAGIVKNYALHLGTAIDDLNSFVRERTFNLLGNEANNNEANFMGASFAMVYSNHEDDAGNFILIILITIAILSLIILRKKFDKNVFIAAVTLVFGFLLLSILLRWNPWLSRLHTPLFMLGCAVVAAILSGMNSRVSDLILLLCLFGSGNILLFGVPRSTLSLIDVLTTGTPRMTHYFDNNSQLSEKYSEIGNFLKEKNLPEVGLMMEGDYRNYTFGDWEYPLWLMLKDDFSAKPLIRHVGLKNVSNTLAKDSSMPEWIITAGTENNIGGAEYEEVLNKENLRLLKKK